MNLQVGTRANGPRHQVYPRTTIKSQTLVDLVLEWTEVQLLTPDVTHEYWMMYFDVSIMAPSLGARVVLISPDGSRLRYVIYLHF